MLKETPMSEATDGYLARNYGRIRRTPELPETAYLEETDAVEGTFVLMDPDGKVTVSNAELADTQFVPASTFKIPNTLIGRETGVIKDERFPLKWDRTKRHIEEWNRDHELATAMKHSV